MTRVFTLPGWHDSAEPHWQTQWERLDARITRVQQANWAEPDADAWLARLRDALNDAPEPTVLAAHSLGCHLVARLGNHPSVCGALLVAPPDLRRDDLPIFVRAFATEPTALGFPATVIASSDDPWCAPSHAQALAAGWGARFVDAGAHGHLNSESALGTWPFGVALLNALRANAPFALDARLARDTTVLAESATCLLLLFDDARYPWCVLVPKVPGASELHELPEATRLAVQHDVQALSVAMSQTFTPDKLNVGALGNVVRQLHLHHVARRLGDPAWPGPVWGHSPRAPRAAAERDALAQRLLAHPALSARFVAVKVPSHGP